YVEAFEKVPASGTTTATIGRREVPIVVKEKPQVVDLPWPEGRTMFSLAHGGEGAPWAIVQSRAAIPLKQPFGTGYRVTRSVAPVDLAGGNLGPGLRRGDGTWTRGDVYRVTLDVEAQSDMTWVVVDDPIPSGA